MKIIDAHMHFSNIESFKRTAREISKVDYSSVGLQKEYEESGVVCSIAMGLTEVDLGGFPDEASHNPMELDLEDKLPTYIKGCLGINPVLIHSNANRNQELDQIELAIQKDWVVGLKIYAGYYRHYVYDDVYQPVYDLAEKYNLPIVIHMGDTFSERGLLKYSHPLTVDELAVSRRKIKFVIAHMGDPWVMDGAEVIAKNYNVYGDISGLLVAEDSTIQEFEQTQLFMDHIRRGIIYANRYDKLLFGTDWPLAPIASYIRFAKKLIPEYHYEKVFYQNALEVFPSLSSIL